MTEYVEYKIEYLKSTEKAWNVKIDGVEFWIPKSCSIMADSHKYIHIAAWFDARREKARALFSDDKKHRYVLSRNWNMQRKVAMVIGLNPSTANGDKNDPTISRLMETLDMLGYGGLVMVNLFTVISSDPGVLSNNTLYDHDEDRDIGIIFGYALGVEEIIFAWGSFNEAKARAPRVIDFFPDAKCFGKNKDGSPWHPMAMLYEGLKPGSNLIKLFNFREHMYENNVKNSKTKRNKEKAKLRKINKRKRMKSGGIEPIETNTENKAQTEITF